MKQIMIAAFIILSPSICVAQSLQIIPDEELSSQIKNVSLESEQMVTVLQSGKAGDVSFKNPDAIYQFYRDRDFDSFWSNGSSRASSRAQDALEIMEQADYHGLNPDNYAVGALQKLIDDGFDDPLTFELMMSEAVICYTQDMTGIRVKPSAIGTDSRSWRPMDAYDLLKFIEEKNDVTETLESLEPQGELYTRLKSELKATQKSLIDGKASLLANKKFPGSITPGVKHPLIKSVRHVLDVSGSSDVYDDDLVGAVKDFQRASGLKDDGVIGERTFKALQRGPMQKMVQIIATMERLRWLPRNEPVKYVEVNIARQIVSLIKDGRVVEQIPVIVGRPDRATQDFIAHIKGIRFNPSWHVPPTIKSEDLLPALRKDTNALAKKGIELVQYTSDGAKKIDPATIDWNNVTTDGLKAYGMVQDPGDENPLGRVRVLMPNKYDIYLHDTNTPELFSKSYRALSSGCIRVADPKKLANFILEEREGWSDETMNQILSTTKTKELSTDDMLVYLTYQTIWMDDGRLITGTDIYDNDMKLYKALLDAKKLPQSLQF
jgi:murein L,D-transpeptidase YcbB/YkuD